VVSKETLLTFLRMVAGLSSMWRGEAYFIDIYCCSTAGTILGHDDLFILPECALCFVRWGTFTRFGLF